MVTPLTAPFVPHGMNTGVSTAPCGVVRRPRRALPSAATRSKRNAATNGAPGTDHAAGKCAAGAGRPEPQGARARHAAGGRVVVGDERRAVVGEDQARRAARGVESDAAVLGDGRESVELLVDSADVAQHE